MNDPQMRRKRVRLTPLHSGQMSIGFESIGLLCLTSDERTKVVTQLALLPMLAARAMGNRLRVVFANVTDGFAQRRLGYRGLTGQRISDAHTTHDPSIWTSYRNLRGAARRR